MNQPWYVILVHGIVQVLRLGGFVLVVWLVIIAVRQWMGVKRANGFLPKPAPHANWLARATDSLLLVSITGGIVAASVVWYSQTDPSSWGNEPEALVWWNNAVAVMAFASVLACGLISFFWQTGPSMALSVVCLLGYAYFADGRNLKQWILDKTPMPTESDCPITIEHTEQISGADVWINGVYFGQTPIKTTLANLLAVPEWRTAIGRGETRRIPGWSMLTFRRELFCQSTLNGESMGVEGYVNGSGSSLDEQNRQWRPGTISISHTFPKFNAELKRLIQWVQLHDHQVDDVWLAALDSYAEPGLKALREAVKNDPECLPVLDQVIARKYGTDQRQTADEAWNAIERIAAKADEILEYSTDSLAGLAVERIAPKLDPHRLANFVKNRLRANPNVRVHSYYYGERNGVQFFEPSLRRGRQERGVAPHSAFVWAYAVSRLDYALDQQDDSHDNPVEAVIVPFLLIDRQGHGLAQRFADSLGGSVIDRWLRWRMTQPQEHRSTTSLGSEQVSQIEWDLTQSKTPTGKDWRNKHLDKVLRFAELASKEHFETWTPQLDWLFFDFDGSDLSLAARFWPRFRETVITKRMGFDPSRLQSRWEYLVRLEPLSTVDMYFNCWLDQKPDAHMWDISSISGLLAKIPADKRRVLLQRIVQRTESAFAENKKGPNLSQLEDRHRFWQRLRGELTIPAAVRFAQAIERYDIHQAKELLNRPFDDPMFAHLVESPSAKARAAFVRFLTEQPTPRHREWLAKLATDSDADVRASAAQAIQDLQQQAAEPPPVRKSSPPAAKLGEVTFAEPPLESPSR